MGDYKKMDNQEQLFKGELMEEKLRGYFLNNHYYVLRGVDYKFDENQITDIDLFLYGRGSSLNRERINVDIKNKRSPKAFERIIWTKGIQMLLKLDNCVVATTDKRESLRKYGLENDVIILDGNFLNKLSTKTGNRISEEDFLKDLSKYRSYNDFNNSPWKDIYQNSKSRLLSELDFSGFNQSNISLKYFLKKCYDHQKRDTALKAVYVTLSHTLIILDYILKNIAFLDIDLRQEKLQDGFQYGNLGTKGVDYTIGLALQISNSNRTIGAIKKSIENPDVIILKEYFSKIEVIKNVFRLAVEFEGLCFQNNLIYPNNLSSDAKGVLGIFLDYFKINRKDFFDLFPVK